MHILGLSHYLHSFPSSIPDFNFNTKLDRLLLHAIHIALNLQLTMRRNSAPVYQFLLGLWVIEIESRFIATLVLELVEIVEVQHVETMGVVNQERDRTAL